MDDDAVSVTTSRWRNIMTIEPRPATREWAGPWTLQRIDPGKGSMWLRSWRCYGACEVCQDFMGAPWFAPHVRLHVGPKVPS